MNLGLLAIALLFCGTELASAQGVYGYTGDQGKDAISPGFTDWYTSTATCSGVYYPNLFGMSIRQYNSCSGSSAGGMTVKTYLPDITRAVIYDVQPLGQLSANLVACI
jgi:hypothetical protein